MNSLFLPKDQEERDLLSVEPEEKPKGDALVYSVGSEIFGWTSDNSLGYITTAGKETVHALEFKPESDNGKATLYWGGEDGFGIVKGDKLSAIASYSLGYFDNDLWYAGDGASVRNFFTGFHTYHEASDTIHALYGYEGHLYAGSSRLIKTVYKEGGKKFSSSGKRYSNSVVLDMCIHDSLLMVARNSSSDFSRRGIISDVHSAMNYSLPPYIRGLTSANGRLYAGGDDGMWDVLEEDKILSTPGTISALTTVPDDFLRRLFYE